VGGTTRYFDDFFLRVVRFFAGPFAARAVISSIARSSVSVSGSSSRCSDALVGIA
jgi:hypothetical protein